MQEYNVEKVIKPVAYFKSPFSSKFGIPRQSGVVDEVRGRIVLAHDFRREEALRGIEGFSHLWLVWGFSGNDGKWNLFKCIAANIICIYAPSINNNTNLCKRAINNAWGIFR